MRKSVECPVCGSDKYKYTSYYGEGYSGICEQHGYCDNCGYYIEQAYSPIISGFIDNCRGRACGKKYFEKDEKRHKRIRKKCGIKTNKDVLKLWMVKW